ncbi:YbhB/YbcL family Raf kinase inhibitor-like protein [Candidatus Pacearchaeota archaeon CG10_big_fil_rev_8_21_14_0_10_34_12]|nr:MAG: YbhB/YbcL family Raf kinase inhibitor-like protein [Candidatus Pacearchaeota archaeon CG10_big_fil_rev_8_21_14_0_10_34_12]
MELRSPAFENGGKIPSKYTCDSEDLSPRLEISNIPEGTKSLVLIMDDPDAPIGMWVHWVVFNISPETKVIPEGEEPKGIHGKGTGGNKDYMGPCPPGGEHRYFFKLYALDTELDLNEGATKTDVEGAMENHILEKSELVGKYKRE